jgi:hypothetical protein
MNNGFGLRLIYVRMLFWFPYVLSHKRVPKPKVCKPLEGINQLYLPSCEGIWYRLCQKTSRVGTFWRVASLCILRIQLSQEIIKILEEFFCYILWMSSVRWRTIYVLLRCTISKMEREFINVLVLKSYSSFHGVLLGKVDLLDSNIAPRTNRVASPTPVGGCPLVTLDREQHDQVAIVLQTYYPAELRSLL